MLAQADFIALQRQDQAAHFDAAVEGHAGHRGAAYRLPPHRRVMNLAPSLRETAEAYFGQHGITWHLHASHGLSSQACCLNFLMPLAERPELLARLIGGVLDIPPPAMIEVEDGPQGKPWFVGFEWTGKSDYLNEWPLGKAATRGANATSADAIVRFKHGGRKETLLIEWKYTETYGAPLQNAPREGKTSNEVRITRYRDLAFAPDGPIHADLGLAVEDFFWEPFYQCLRQQMLAFQMQKAAEDGAERVRVLHISPTGNRSLHKVTAPALRQFGDDAFEAFRAVLVDPDGFISRSTEQVFGSLLAQMAGDPWSDYLTSRYSFLRE
jgi:hypothetical protein